MPGTPHRAIVVMARYPVPGCCKTRLIAALGPEGAASLHAEMTSHALDVAGEAAVASGANVMVSVSDGEPSRMQELFGPEPVYVAQREGDLGERLAGAFAERFEAGADEVLAIAADCPDIEPSTIEQAFDALSGSPVVIGPATDGGYYLVGIARHAAPVAIAELFTDIAWSTETVLRQTRARAAAAGLDVVVLETLSDVDEPSDLPVWERAKSRFSAIDPVA